MLANTDFSFSVANTDKSIVCWLCKEIINRVTYPTHVVLEFTKHIPEYRSHLSCLYEFFGVFCMFGYAIAPAIDNTFQLRAA